MTATRISRRAPYGSTVTGAVRCCMWRTSRCRRPARARSWSRFAPRGSTPARPASGSARCTRCFPATFPSGEGSDLAGVVTAVGPGVTEFSVGDEVLGFSFRRSSHATHTAVPVDQLIRKPPQMSWEVAGSLYVVGATAYAAVRAVAPQPGETVAVSAAAGGVGSLAVQLLVLRKARVLGIAGPGNADWLRAHNVIPIAYGDGLADRLRAAAPDGIDAFIDLFGPDYVQLAVDLGVAPERIDTIISFQKAGEVGAKTEGSMRGVDTGGARRNGRPDRHRRHRFRDRRDLSAGPGRRRVRGTRETAHARQNRSAAQRFTMSRPVRR